MKTAFVMVAAAFMVIYGASLDVGGQAPDDDVPTVRLVDAIGCVERDGESWFLTRATDPEETELPFSSHTELQEARLVSLGAKRLQLVGVTDFLDAEGLLSSYQRAEFTAPESANATGQLTEGRKVVVKGLHITSVEPHRINLTSVLSLADRCR